MKNQRHEWMPHTLATKPRPFFPIFSQLTIVIGSLQGETESEEKKMEKYICFLGPRSPSRGFLPRPEQSR